ncbi:glycosyltransferase family 2 protein [Microterricola viridarii]|uniref:Glycosyltransferase, catalytic subunit of cellulose synthase and poly-beta-1,6-N-acetylglucosamine synthase n=1 Tax=Microterricola viridarii TaxID=412690 RepID=A0A1H1WLR2_9MICO|nr:glycosyltransferase family 2 protein [Microterricola viridarii]SDS98187.1 Glycosyltransferase, catalytic subunit of cellulose synthase and poly-beta-1,6-N-acetylglucosamine synthase [Microterricola viridarii]
MRKWNFSRWAGLSIAGLVTAAAGLLWFAVAARVEGGEGAASSSGLLLGLWSVLYNTQAPSESAVFAAIALALLLAAGIAIIERRIATRYRRSSDGTSTPLAPKIIMAATRGVFAGPITITVLIPAHNEEASLPDTLDSLFSQSPPPDRVIVVADNCTDGTERVAAARGVEVFRSVGNAHKKAGALNQALAVLLPDQGDNDVVMIMDADTQLDGGFLAAAASRFASDRALMAVGGLFYGEPGHGLIGQFQRNEYIRYSRELKRRRGRVFVLTGTASLFRAVGLRAVASGRGTSLPGIPGDVYDTAALTEDNELTIALKSLGGLITSPSECTVVTELMPTWRTLWNQRLRWQRGALENLGAYGVKPQTVRYWAQQLGIGYGVIALFGYLSLLLVMALSLDTWVWFPFWLGIGAVFTLERVVTVWKGGWRARLLAVLLIPELCFDMFLNCVYVKGILDSAIGRRAAWTHLQHEARAEEEEEVAR